MTDPIPWLRAAAREEANRWNEPAYIVTAPPPTTESALASASTIAYIVLESMASAAEKAAAVERVEPEVPVTMPEPETPPVIQIGGITRAPRSEVWYEETVTVEPEWME